MPTLVESRAAAIAGSVSEIFNQQYKLDQNQALKVADIIGHDPNFNRKPDYWINVFNISSLSFVRHRPVDFPTIRIEACPKGQPWMLAVRVPNIVNYKWTSAETGQPSFSSIRGERFATDLINPANLGEQMWIEITDPMMDEMHGGSDDLSRRGVFWSRRQPFNHCAVCDSDKICPDHDVPSAEDLTRARTRMERHYRLLTQRADAMANDPKTRGDIGEEHHHAADYLHINAAWHLRTQVQEGCPNCGEPVNPGIAYHMSSMGPCILDWKRAVSAGIKMKADVPEEHRWWTEEKVANGDPEHRGKSR